MHYKTVPLSLMLLLFTYSSYGQSSVKTVETPKAGMTINPQQSILKNTEGSENHQMLLAVMRASDLEEVLGQDGPFTVFAPSDTAFEKLSKAKIDALLLPENKKELQSLMRYHIIAGNFSASKILKAMCRGAGKATFTTVQGDELTATMDGLDIVLTDNQGNTARITTADYNQCNGVIHEIDSVIRPGKI